MQYTLVEPPWGNGSYGRPGEVFVAHELGSSKIIAVLHLINVDTSDGMPDMVFTLQKSTLDHVRKKQIHTDLAKAKTRAEGKAVQMPKAEGKAAEVLKNKKETGSFCMDVEQYTDSHSIFSYLSTG